MDDGKRGLEENVANVEMLPVPNPISNERSASMKKKIIFAALAVVVGLSLCGLVYCWYNSALQVMLVNVSGKEMCCKLSVRDKVVCETTIKPSCAEIVKLRDYAEGGLYAVVNGKAYSEAVNYLSPGIDRPFALVLVDEDNAPIVCEIEEATK